MLIFYTKKGTIYKRRPHSGHPVIIGWDNGKYTFPIHTKWQQYFDLNKMAKLNDYIQKQDPSGVNLLLFEDLNGQIVPPDARRKLLGLYFTWGAFNDIATNGYVKLTKAERVILQAYSDKEVEIFDHRGFFELIPNNTTLEAEIIECFKSDPFLSPLLSNVTGRYYFKFQGQFIGVGEKADLIGGYTITPKKTFWIREMAGAILSSLWNIGYRFTSLKKLKQINKKLLNDKMQTKTGEIKRKDLEQIEEEIYINYTVKKLD